MSTINPGREMSLDWPEEDQDQEQKRRVFYQEMMEVLGPAKWVAIVPTPVPLGAVRASIESQCGNLLDAIKMPKKGLAWIVEGRLLNEVLPGLFHARRPELVFLAYSKLPSAEAIASSLGSRSGSPASVVLFFDEGELVEKRSGK